MRITGSPGSYEPVRLGNPYASVIRGMPIRNWTSCDVLVTCKRVVYGFSTGFLQFCDDVLAKGSQEPVRLPYGACASTIQTRTCLRTPVEFYDHCTWPVRVPVMAVSAHTCLLRGKKMCMHNFQTRAAHGYKGSIRAQCGPIRYAVRSPTGHWNFGPYSARKLPGSSMWPRHKQLAPKHTIICQIFEQNLKNVNTSGNVKRC